MVVDNEAAQAAIEFETHLSRMADSVKGLAVDIGAELLPGINDYIESTTRASESTHILVGAASVVGNNFREIAAIGSGVATIFAARWALTGAANIGSYVLALTRSTQAMGAAAGAARALSAALGVVGGPIGAISLALGAGVTAWQLWGSEVGQARISATDLKKEVEELRGELDSLHLVELEGERRKFHKKYELEAQKATEAAIALQALERDYQELLQMQQRGYNITEKELDNLRGTINDLERGLIKSSREMETYANLLVEIENAARRAAGGVDELNSSVSSKIVDDFIADAEERMRRIRMGVSAVARAQEIIKENPSLDPKQKEEILEIARAEDALRNSLRKTTSTVKTQIDEGQRYIQQLQERIALLGKETEYERLLAQMSVGAITFREQAQEKEAIAQAQTLDFLEEQMRAVEQAKLQAEEYQQLMHRLYPEQAEYERFIADVELLHAALEDGYITIGQYIDAMARLEGQSDETFNAMTAMADMAFTSVGNSIADMLATGEADFKSFADGIVREMMRMMMQAMIIQPLMQAMGFASGGYVGGGVNTSYAPDISGYYASGGYTGDGGKYEPAGIVHRGEYVFSKEAVNRLGVGTLERLHRNSKGYASGGLVGGGATPIGAPAGVNVDITINSQGSPQTESSAGMQKFAREIGEFVEAKYRELEVRSQRQGGIAWRAKQGRF